MSRPLQTILKALESAVNNLKNERASKSLNTGTALLKKVKHGDALTTERAQNLVAFFDEELAILYSLLPQLTVKFSTVYFTDLFRVFKAEQPPELWQHVAGKGILSGLLAFIQTENAGVDTHFDKAFITVLCQLLNSPSSSKKLELSTNFRRCVGSFLAAVTANNEKAKKWILESKFLGITGLSSLIVNETEFRILDACLEIATRLAPKRSDPQARRAFFRDLFNSKLSKATFGEEACKRLLRVMEQPVKGRTWFEIADQMFAEMGGNADRLQRFVTEHLVISGQTFSEKNASVRMYLDTEITFNAFLLEEDEEVMITTSYNNLTEIQIDYMEGSAKAKLTLKSPPSWENPNELSSQATSTLITLQLSAPEMTRFQKVLKLRGQAAKLVDHAKHTKQSFSVHPTQLGQSNPPAPPPLEAKAAVLKAFVPSPTPIDLSTSPLNPSKGSTRPDIEKLPEAQPELNRLLPSPPEPQQPLVSSHRKSVVKVTKNGVRGGVIIDSDDDLGEGRLTKSAVKPGLKRKASELSEMDDDVRVLSPEPVRKKLRAERTDAGTKPSSSKKGLSRNSKPLALGGSTKVNRQIQAKVPTVAASSLKPRKPTPPQTHSRINGMTAKDGTRPIAASTPPRRGRPVEMDVPRSVQGHSQRPVKEIPEAKPATLPVRGAKSQAKPEKAIWETEDFSQKAGLMFIPTGAAITEMIDKAFPIDYHAEGIVLDNEVEAIIVPDIEPAAMEDIPETPGPPNFSRKLDTPIQDDGPSSPIRPVMALKRKLRDADTLSQRLHAQISPAIASPVASVIKIAGNLAPNTDDDQSPDPNRNDIEAMYPPPKESKRNPEVDSLRSFFPIKDGQRRRPVVNWAVPINPARLRPTTGPGDAKQSAVDKSSKVSVAPNKGIRDANRKVPKHNAPPPPPPVETTDDESGNEAEQREVTPAPPKSDIDGIAEVLTAIQDTILENIQGKFSGVRREARLARANLLENAVVDLEVMQENHDKSFARFMRLEEKCGEVTQDIIGGLEEVDATNQAIIANLNAIIREHDEATAALRAARKPLFPKHPPCLEV